jgi:putative transcriptional regulator
MMTEPNRVRKYRLRQDRTQEELAQDVGITRQTLGLIETGSYNPSLKVCIALAKSLDVTLNDLFWNGAEDG